MSHIQQQTDNSSNHESSRDGLILPFQRRSIVSQYIPTEGSGALLVLVDGSGPYPCRSIVYETILCVLEHLGLPYRLFDVGYMQIDYEQLRECAAVIVAQEHITSKLRGNQAAIIAQAIEAGVGYVSFDWDLREYDPALLELFSFDTIDEKPFATNSFYVQSNDHPITCLHPAPALIKS